MAKAAKLIEAQRDRPPEPISRERIRPRPRPLGEKDLSSFEPRPPLVDPVKEKAREAVAAMKKKKEKKKRGALEEAAEESGAKRVKVAPTDAEVPAAKDAPEVVEIIPTVEVVEMAPPVQVEAGLGEAAPSGREQVQRRPDPQEGGVRVAMAIYHVRAVAGKLEGEEGPARVGADRLVKIVDEGALRAASGNEELVRQKDEADSRIGDLLKELGEERARAEEDKGRLRREWKMEKAKVAAELESLRKRMEEERATAAAERGALQRELDEERAKAASEKAAYPDLCVAAVEQYKGSLEFQMVVDAAVARSLAGQEPGGVGPSRKIAGGRTESERKAEELFPNLDLSSVTIGEDDVAQTPLDEGVEEEDLASSEEE
ncbi:uncharacterized protein LOC114305207 [Camellia sinensis]|uniref:uncharacterized protein LOC114305207 n=1 Tax=Camellia sinensis TaxID=4442 RepID=UPI0010358647|nr:uncharacterized protein LOC114305207 [Camellia sinensis]